MPAVVARTTWPALPEASDVAALGCVTAPASCQLDPLVDVYSLVWPTGPVALGPPVEPTAQATMSCCGLVASSACDGSPLGCAGPGEHGAWLTFRHAPPDTGPVSTAPVGVSKYPVVPVTTRAADAACPVVIVPGGTVTGVHVLLPATDVFNEKLVHTAAYADPDPVQVPNRPSAGPPAAASTSMTRCPPVDSWYQGQPPPLVSYSAGPKAQPFRRLANRSWLTPAPPSGLGAVGALTPYQVLP